jgi:glycosyltransferase involved in cell wall biosynthesis
MINVSVIIPAYNVDQFIQKAIYSALEQPEIQEVIVVNDGSTDDTERVVENLQKTDNRIKLFYHENKVNRGRAASRNLALKRATQEYIAFLDADDYFLHNRFEADCNILVNDKSVDGVYNAIGVHFYRVYTEEESDKLSLVTVSKKIPSEYLFNEIINQKTGYFSIDGLTIRKDVLLKIGYFNEKLKVAEDTEWIYKLTLKCKLLAGNITNPVAMRGVHDNNVFNQSELYIMPRQRKYESVISWAFKNEVENDKIDLLMYWLFYYRYKQNYGIIKEVQYWCYLVFTNPKLLLSSLAIKYFPIVRKRKKIFTYIFK